MKRPVFTFFQSTSVAFFAFLSFASENKLKRTENIIPLLLLLHTFCLLLLHLLHNVAFLVHSWQ